MTSKILKGRTAIVTGAGSGIGKAIATLFHGAGARVLVADINAGAARQVAAALGHGAAPAQADVTKADSVAAMVEEGAKLGALDTLINCAGVPQLTTPVEDVDEATFDRIMRINVNSIFLTAKYAVPHLKRAGGGSIVSIASIVGVRPKAGIGAYCASKAAAIALSQSLALELAPFGIRVNAINPGAADTPMLGQFMKPGADVAAGRQAFAAAIPMGELVKPDDVAQAALYLASPAARLVTGVALNVDGGRTV